MTRLNASMAPKRPPEFTPLYGTHPSVLGEEWRPGAVAATRKVPDDVH